MAMSNAPLIETFANPHPQRSYLIVHHVHEFTSLCPKTGQPDFARLGIEYVPGPSCIELKSLKLYLQGFRSRGIFYEDITNVMLDDLAAACSPRWMSVRSVWSVRGGIHSVIVAQLGNPETARLLLIPPSPIPET